MALPKKVSEQLSQVPSRTPGASGSLLMLTTILLTISLASYFGLKFGYEPYLNDRIEKLDLEIEAFTKQIPPEKQTEIISLYSQLSNLKTLLTQHTFTSKFFEWFEKYAQINASYQNLRFDPIKGDIILTGQARTVNDIGEQLMVMNQLPEVKSISLSNISNNTNGFQQFDLRISIDPKVVSRSFLLVN